MNPRSQEPAAGSRVTRRTVGVVVVGALIASALACLAAVVFGPAGGGDAVTAERLLDVRRAAHGALADRLNQAPEAGGDALALDLRLPGAAVTARPLGPDAAGDPWFEVTVSMLDTRGRVVEQQSERVAFYRPEGRWTVSRILIDGLEE